MSLPVISLLPTIFQTVGTKLLHPHLSYPNEKPKTKLNPLKSKGDNL